MKNIILKHKNILLSEEVKERYNLNEWDIVSAATLPELDEAYTRKVKYFSIHRKFDQISIKIDILIFSC